MIEMASTSGESTFLTETLAELHRLMDDHVKVVERLKGVFDHQLAPYCAIFAERIERQVLPVLADGIEAATILHHTEMKFPECTTLALMSHVEAALKLISWKEVENHGA